MDVKLFYLSSSGYGQQVHSISKALNNRILCNDADEYLILELVDELQEELLSVSLHGLLNTN